jgi:hypothetical protein
VCQAFSVGRASAVVLDVGASGARVTPYNRQFPAKGAVVRIAWPRKAIEAPEGWIES